MQRNKIKADGTLYAVKRSYGTTTATRVVETKRLWTYSRSYREPRIYLSIHDKMGTSDRSTFGWRTHYDGYLIVRAEDNDTEMLEALRALDVSGVAATGTTKDLETWQETLPEGLSVGVAVTRQFLDEWDAYNEKAATERVSRNAECEKAARDREASYAAEARVTEALRAYGVYTTHHSFTTPPRANVTVDAETLANLLEKLSPQRVLDAVADHLRETFDFSPVDERIMQEIQGALPAIQAEINDELK